MLTNRSISPTRATAIFRDIGLLPFGVIWAWGDRFQRCPAHVQFARWVIVEGGLAPTGPRSRMASVRSRQAGKVRLPETMRLLLAVTSPYPHLPLSMVGGLDLQGRAVPRWASTIRNAPSPARDGA